MHQTKSYDDGISFEAWKAEFNRVIGAGPRGRWVIARRTPNIMARYGEDVVCLSNKQYENADRIARLNLTQGYD
jgi:hypothetical protein